MKRVKSLRDLHALAAAQGASIEDGARVFNAERQVFKLRSEAPVPVADRPAPASGPAVAPAAPPAREPGVPVAEWLRIAHGVEAAALAQAQTNRMLAQAIAARPTAWRFEIERDASGTMEAVTVTGD